MQADKEADRQAGRQAGRWDSPHSDSRLRGARPAAIRCFDRPALIGLVRIGTLQLTLLLMCVAAARLRLLLRWQFFSRRRIAVGDLAEVLSAGAGQLIRSTLVSENNVRMSV